MRWLKLLPFTIITFLAYEDSRCANVFGQTPGAASPSTQSASPRRFNSEMELSVYIDCDPKPSRLGITPAKQDIEIPAGADWYIEPKPFASTVDMILLATEIEKQEIPALELLEWREGMDLGALKGLKTLNRLSLTSTHLNDEGLRRLTDVPGLKRLDLVATRITDAGLTELHTLESLEELDLRLTRVTDAGVKHLSQVKGLRVLHLAATKISDTALDEVREMTQLRVLNLSANKITDIGLGKLANSNIEVLYLGSTSVTDSGLGILKQLPNLQTLNLVGANVTDAGLQQLKELRTLRNLDLRDTRVTDVGIAQLKAELPRCKIEVTEHSHANQP